MQRNASAPQLEASGAETKRQAVHTAICTRLLLINAWEQTVTALVATTTPRAAVPTATYIRGDFLSRRSAEGFSDNLRRQNLKSRQLILTAQPR